MAFPPFYRPDPQFLQLKGAFADAVAPARFPKAQNRFFNARWAAAIGLEGLGEAEREAHFARFEPLPGNLPVPLALRYHGHQFRVYNPQLGDGRGFLFAQLRDCHGRLLDLATKGSGRTPWSRTADGRLTLKGAVREVLAASMLEAQGVDSSKAFAVFETGEELQRGDEPSPTRSAVLTRLGHSHIRFGTFQRLAYLGLHEDMRELLQYCLANYFPVLAGLAPNEQPGAFLFAVMRASAALAAGWMAAGFVHGVLNTDNLVITGESFDYGPWRFLPHSDPGFVAAYFDHSGLYAFGRQPEAVGWNLAQLAGALSAIAPMEALTPALEAYGPAYSAALIAAVHQRLGLTSLGNAQKDGEFLSQLFTWMGQSRAGWAQTFHDWFCGEASAGRAALSPQAGLYGMPEFAELRRAIAARTPLRPERLAHLYFARARPADLVIETVEALWAPIAEADDWATFHACLAEIEAMRTGLDLQPEARLRQEGA
jgi:serine/tyrosine/threonine adenylyltransferase